MFISYIAMVINKRNYNSNMYCCMNNKQLIQLSTPNYSKVLTHSDAKEDDLKMILPPKQTIIYISVAFNMFIVYVVICILQGLL